jgi:hypothetical protein
MRVMAGRYGSILLIVILVFATLFLMLYICIGEHSSLIPTAPKLTEDQVINIMKTDIQRRVGNVLADSLFERFA